MSSRKWNLVVGLASTLAVVLAAGHALARDVKRCGITIGTGKTGTLVQDVECGYRCAVDSTVRCVFEREDYSCPIDRTQGCTAETIVLGRNATLDLNGFTLASAYQQDGVICAAGSKSRCTITGPGTFLARKGRAITPNDRDVVLKNLLVSGDYQGFTTAGWVRATNVELLGCSASMVGEKGVRATGVRVNQSCGLSSGKNLYLNDVFVADSVQAVGTVRGTKVTVQNGAVIGKDVFLANSHIPAPLDTELDVYDQNVRAERKLVLRDVVAGGIASGDAPKLVRSSCMQSYRPGGGNWGLCALD
jgi:hypothetical protein